MSKTTANYGFTLEDDTSTKFKEWRESINGIEGSNFVRLDTILYEKSDKSKNINVTIFADKWSDKAPFVQELEISGLSVLQNGNIALPQDATGEQIEAAVFASLSVIGQEENKLIILAEEKPGIDIPAIVTLLG